MTKAFLRVHAFVVQRATTLASALDQVRNGIQTLPHLRTAILISERQDCLPTHILSREPEIAAKLHEAYPGASVDDSLVLASQDGSEQVSELHEGPWCIVLDSDSLTSRPTTIALPAEEENLRLLACGDEVLIAAKGEHGPLVHAAGVIRSMTRSGSAVQVAIQPSVYFRGPISLEKAPATVPELPRSIQDGAPLQPEDQTHA
jgi:hypothetical protein